MAARAPRALPLVLLVFAGSTPSYLSEGRSARPAPATKTDAALEGTVTGPGGRPVEGALVTAVPSGAPRPEPVLTRSDARGRFRLALRTPVLHDVRVEARGLAARVLERVPPGAPLAVRLDEGLAIEGVVRTTAGAPLPGARVEAWSRGFRAPSTWEPDAGVVDSTSDARGRFRIEGLAPGRYAVTASVRGHGRARKPDVPAGGRVELLLPPSGSSLFGSVLGAGGRPVAGAAVRAEDESSRWRSTRPVLTDAAGTFEVPGVGPGRYALVARHAEHAPAVLAGVVVEEDADARADFLMYAGVPVGGRLVDEEERPLAGRVAVEEAEGRSAPRCLAELLRADAGADGRFRLDRVAPGPYVLVASAPGRSPRRLDFHVPARGAPVDLGDVALEVGLAISGRVRDPAGQGIAGASIVGYPVAPMAPSRTPVEAQAETDGGFVLAGLVPARYRLDVSAPGYAFVASRGANQVDAGTRGVQLVMEPGGSIAGRVVDASGLPVPVYTVVVERSEAEPVTFVRSKPVASTDGRFAIEDLAAGTYIVQVDAPERVPATVSGVRVAAGVATDVGRVRIGPGGVVRGTVGDAAGGGVAGAQVTLWGPGAENAMVAAPEATADTEGRFEVRGVVAGPAEATATHRDYAVGTAALDVDPEVPAEVRIVLTQGGRIEGSARRRDGSPVTNARVQVSREDIDQRTSLPFGRTREDGSFVFDHVSPGRASVRLMVPQAAGAFVTVLGRDVDVREGETTLLELVSREVFVSGRVTRSGTPQPDVHVSLMGGGWSRMSGRSPAAPAGPQPLTGVTRDDGGYELIAEPGAVTVRLESLDGRLRVMRRVEIPDADAHTVDFTLSGSTLAGWIVEKETDRPVARARVFARPEGEGGGASTAGESGPDGRFQIDLDPGDYHVHVSAEGYVSEALAAAVPDGGGPEIRIELTRGLGLAGRVVDPRGRGVPGLEVSATVEEGRGGDWTVTLADGSFRLAGLADRVYNLIAGTALAGFGVRRGVRPGDEDVVLSLRPGGRVRLSVRGADGAPVQGAYVRVSRVAGAAVIPASGSPTDARGTAEIPAPLGQVEIEAIAGMPPERMAGRVTVTVPEGGVATAELALAPQETQRER